MVHIYYSCYAYVCTCALFPYGEVVVVAVMKLLLAVVGLAWLHCCYMAFIIFPSCFRERKRIVGYLCILSVRHEKMKRRRTKPREKRECV